MFCEYCGAQIDDNAKMCPACGMLVDDAADFEPSVNQGPAPGAYQAQESRPVPTPEQPEAQTPKQWTIPKPDLHSIPIPSFRQEQAAGGISAAVNRISDMVLAEGETIVRQYQCASVSKAAGFLTVTNKRVMFHAVGNNSRLSQEVSMPSVSGLSCYYGTNYDIKKFIFGGLFALLGIIVMIASGNVYEGKGIMILIGLLFLALAALMVYLGIERSFLLGIFAKDTSDSPINIGQGPKTLLGNSALLALRVTRTAETDRMINELGAMIQDLQTLGDHAIEKWQKGFDFGNIPTL